MSLEELQSKITVFGPHCQKDPAKEGAKFRETAEIRRAGGRRFLWPWLAH